MFFLYVCQPVFRSTPNQNQVEEGIFMRIRPGHIEIFVSDPITSKDFYTDVLGFQVQEIQLEQYVWLNLDDLTLLLRPGQPQSAPLSYQASNVGIVLYTDHLERTQADLLDRGIEFKGTDGSDRCLTFTDPDGIWFQLVDPNNH